MQKSLKGPQSSNFADKIVEEEQKIPINAKINKVARMLRLIEREDAVSSKESNHLF